MFQSKLKKLQQEHNQLLQQCQLYKEFYEGVMSLTEGTDTYSMQDVPMEARNIIAEKLKNLKIRKSIECNKAIGSKSVDVIVFRNGMIAAIEMFIQMLETDKPASNVSILTREKKGGVVVGKKE